MKREYNISLKKTKYFKSALKFAEKISSKYEKKLKQVDTRFAILRLVGTIVILALIVSYSSKLQSSEIFLVVSAFCLLFIFASVFHKKLQNKLEFWIALKKSYKISTLRLNRDFNALREDKSPWSYKGDVSPDKHFYALDLDVSTHLFTFLDSCVTYEGSKKLWEELHTRGLKPSKNYLKSSLMPKILSSIPKLLRKLEALRLRSDYLKLYYKTKEVKEKDDFKVIKVSSFLIFTFSIIFIIIWGCLIIPSFIIFLKTLNSELFFQKVTLFLPVPLLGLLIYQSIIKKSQVLSLHTKIIQEITKTFENFDSHKLLPFCSFLKESSKKSIAQMNIYLDLMEIRGNPIFWLFLNCVFPFDAVLILLLYRHTKKISQKLQVWSHEVRDLDYAACIARLKYEDKMMRFVSKEEVLSSSKNIYKFENMSHPLIPPLTRISNSIDIGKNTSLTLLTGSNMSGKSTFLRSLAINMLLYNMGGPVCAENFIAPPSKLLCSIKVEDSLSEGTSYFYAEVMRIKNILSHYLANKNESMLIFIDEIFKGTNNKERYIGSFNIINFFLKNKCFAFITTHDLALTEIEKTNSDFRNMHFREHIENDTLKFDYKLREGPSPTTNALFIMKKEGLPIENEKPDTFF